MSLRNPVAVGRQNSDVLAANLAGIKSPIGSLLPTAQQFQGLFAKLSLTGFRQYRHNSLLMACGNVVIHRSIARRALCVLRQIACFVKPYMRLDAVRRCLGFSSPGRAYKQRFSTKNTKPGLCSPGFVFRFEPDDSGCDGTHLTVRPTVAVCVIPPPFPVIVIVLEPVAAFRFTVIVIVEVPAPVIDDGLKLTETRDPLTEPVRAMDELKPPLTVVVMVTFPVLLRFTVKEVGDALIPKPGVTPEIVSVTVVVSTVLPEVPVTVMGYVPLAVPAATAIVMLVLLPAEMGLVVNPMVTPDGWPVADNVIEPEKPPVAALLIVVDPLLPALTETELGEAEMEKPDGAGPLRALMSPAVGLPHPVTRSKPATAE